MCSTLHEWLTQPCNLLPVWMTGSFRDSQIPNLWHWLTFAHCVWSVCWMNEFFFLGCVLLTWVFKRRAQHNDLNNTKLNPQIPRTLRCYYIFVFILENKSNSKLKPMVRVIYAHSSWRHLYRAETKLRLLQPSDIKGLTTEPGNPFLYITVQSSSCLLKLCSF